MTPRAFVAGCAGPQLTTDEAAFFRDADPFGFILFRRNIVAPDQVRALTSALREAVGRADAPVLVDQEGGRVQRLGPPHWPRYPAGRTYARLGGGDLDRQRRLTRLGARLIAHDLRSVGISVDCLPVLDVPVPGAHDIIGDRAYGAEPDIVADLGRAAAVGLMEGGVLPVMKHVPGHGRAAADSHERLPRVAASLAELRERDFRPFRALRDLPVAMTAHVGSRRSIRPARPPPPPTSSAARSGRDRLRRPPSHRRLSMGALSGDFGLRLRRSLEAGCDVGLHCNGDLSEMRAVAEAAPRLAGVSLLRAERALGRLRVEVAAFDPVDARRGLDDALAEAA